MINHMRKTLFLLLMLVSGCLGAAENPIAGKFDDTFNRTDPGFGVGDGKVISSVTINGEY